MRQNPMTQTFLPRVEDGAALRNNYWTNPLIWKQILVVVVVDSCWQDYSYIQSRIPCQKPGTESSKLFMALHLALCHAVLRLNSDFGLNKPHLSSYSSRGTQCYRSRHLSCKRRHCLGTYWSCPIQGGIFVPWCLTERFEGSLTGPVVEGVISKG